MDAHSFEIPAGQIVGFLGPNGAGKSTTLKMLTGMLEPTDGTATICGFDLRQEPIEVKRRVGFVPESGAVFESLTGLEYLEMVAALYAIPEEAARARIRQFIAFFDLSFETLTDKLLGAYSKGMRRKVVITAALLHNPPVVFFDEPLDGLDANAAVGFKALIQTLAQEGKTIVYSSHILDVVERVCHRVIIIDKGRMLLDGEPDNRLPIDSEKRKQNRTLPTPKVLNALLNSLPDVYHTSEVVGKWVWVQFKEQPVAEIR